MDEVMKTLLEKESELRLKLEQTPIFKQWESLKTTITLFENGDSSNGSRTNGSKGLKPPTEYKDSLTWNEKVLFAVNERGQAFVGDMMDVLKKFGEKMDDKALYKRLSTIASLLKRKKVLGSKSVGSKERYFIK